jgi:MtN3 and saliva related transmembrane protein
MELGPATIVGSLAAIGSMTSFVPQAIRIVKTRDTKSLSRVTYSVTVCAFALWAIYGVLLGDWPIIVTNSVCLVFAAFILTMKLLPRAKRDALADKLDPAVKTG